MFQICTSDRGASMHLPSMACFSPSCVVRTYLGSWSFAVRHCYPQHYCPSDARPPVPPGYVVRLPAPQPHQETPRWPSDGRSGLRKWGRGVTTRWSPKGWTPHDFCWSNMVCWKIPYLWMIFSLRPSFVISRTAMFDCWKVYIFHHKLLLFGVTCVYLYIYIHTHVCVCFLVCQDMLKNNCQCKCFRQDDGKARPCFIIDHFGTSVQSIFGVPIGRATGPDVARIWWNWWLQWCNWHRENKIYAWKECGWHVSGKRECLHPVVIRLFLDICLQYVYMSLKSLRYTHTSWKLYKCGLKFKPGRITGVDQIQICTWRGWGCRSLAFCKTKWLNCSVTSKTQILVPHGDCSDKIVQFLW